MARRRTIIFTIIVSLLAFTIGVFLVHYLDDFKLWALLVIFPFFLIAIYISSKKVLKQQESLWDSIRIRLGSNYISFTKENIDEVRIRFDEIEKIIKTSRGLTVFSVHKQDSFVITSALDQQDYLQIEKILSTCVPIEHKDKTEKLKGLFSVLIVLAGFTIILLSQSIPAVSITGFLLFLYCTYIYRKQKSYRTSQRAVVKGLRNGMIFITILTLFKLILLWLSHNYR